MNTQETKPKTKLIFIEINEQSFFISRESEVRPLKRQTFCIKWY